MDDIGACEKLGETAALAAGALDFDSRPLEKLAPNTIFSHGDDANVDMIAIKGKRMSLHRLLGAPQPKRVDREGHSHPPAPCDGRWSRLSAWTSTGAETPPGAMATSPAAAFASAAGPTLS